MHFPEDFNGNSPLPTSIFLPHSNFFCNVQFALIRCGKCVELKKSGSPGFFYVPSFWRDERVENYDSFLCPFCGFALRLAHHAAITAMPLVPPKLMNEWWERHIREIPRG